MKNRIKYILLSVLSLILFISCLSNYEDSGLYGKNISVIGDSYVANHEDLISDTWHYKLALKYDMHYYNFGINGNGLVTDEATGPSVLSRYNEIPKESSYILVIGGKNDHRLQVPLDVFTSGLVTLCESLKSDYPDSIIIFFTPWHLEGDANLIPLDEYSKAVVKVCANYNIPVFDNSTSEVINVNSPQFRKEYMQSENDISHLNPKGHDLFLPVAERFILSLKSSEAGHR